MTKDRTHGPTRRALLSAEAGDLAERVRAMLPRLVQTIDDGVVLGDVATAAGLLEQTANRLEDGTSVEPITTR